MSCNGLQDWHEWNGAVMFGGVFNRDLRGIHVMISWGLKILFPKVKREKNKLGDAIPYMVAVRIGLPAKPAPRLLVLVAH